jgi:transglutaminase-like putative cysteine protease
MRKYILSGILFLVIQAVATAGDINYPVATIPKALLTNADAVIRVQEQVVEINSLNKYSEKEHYVITILNEAGEKYAQWLSAYSKMISINHIDGTLYDATGNKVRSLKKSEIKDYPASDEMTMVTDVRFKYHNFYHKIFPYTVEYEFETNHTGTMFLPEWVPVPWKNVSVEKSKFIFISDPEIKINTRVYNYDRKPDVKIADRKNVMSWELLQQPAFEKEYASPPIVDLAPMVRFTSSEFKLDDFSGSMSSWGDYGKFILSLNEGLDELPVVIKEKVKSLTAGVNSTEEKVYKLYRFMQQNTHYVGIQLGIGGWRPFPANYVATKGYGDCKALSNFMVSLLKEAGIRANYVLITSGEGEKDMELDFPSADFNHAICAVPLQKDTIWLECTSQVTTPGYMGSSTGNRHALMITDNGGKVVRTPHYSKTENKAFNIIEGRIDLNGNLDAKSINNYQAESGDQIHGIDKMLSKEEQLKYLKRKLDLPNYDVTEFSYQQTGEKIPVTIEKISLNAPNYAQITGKRLFVMPNILNKWNQKLAADTARKYGIELYEETVETDSVTIIIPDGYKLETLSKPVEISSSFGKYKSSSDLVGNKIVYIRRLETNKGKFPASEYNNLVKYYDQLYKADHSKLVFVKSE